MVKGTSRRVVVVESPDPHLFEQAIFILRNDAFGRDGVSPQQVVEEAVEVASHYAKDTKRRHIRFSSLPRWLCALAGAGGISLVWLAAGLL